MEHNRHISDHHVDVLCFSVLFKNRRPVERDDVVVSSDTEHINRVREQGSGSGIAELLPQRSLHLLEIPKLSFNVYNLKIQSIYAQSMFSREKEDREKENQCGLID